MFLNIPRCKRLVQYNRAESNPITPGALSIEKATTRVLLTVGLFAAVCLLAYAARRTLIAFLLAMLFAYLLEPVVRRLEPAVKTRARAIALTYAALIAILTVVGMTAGPKIFSEVQILAQNSPSLSEQLGSGQIARQIGSKRGWSYETQMRVESEIRAHREILNRYTHDVATHAAGAAGYLAWIVLIPVLAIFFLREKSQLIVAAVNAADPSKQPFVRGLLTDVDNMLARYVRAQLILAVFGLVAYTTFLTVMRVPYAFALGAIGGLLEFVPFAGPLITATLILLISFLGGYNHILAILVFLGVWRLLQDYVNAPRILGRGVELHPLATIFGILVGGEVAGIIGVFLSVPAMATLRIVLRACRRRSYAQPGNEAPAISFPSKAA